MPATIRSAAVFGIDARPVSVEVDVHSGLPKTIIVGLPDSAVQEARDRIYAAIRNAGFTFPYQRVTINLSPADWRKEGPGFDLPIALALLVETGQLRPVFDRCLVVGQLSLAGAACAVAGILSMAEYARHHHLRMIVPEANALEAAHIHGTEVIPVRDLTSFVVAAQSGRWPTIDTKDIVSPTVPTRWSTWPSIRGQVQAKRAVTIAAAGHHNVLMIGPPGSGKTMLAEGMRELLPTMSEEECLDVTKIYSVAGRLPTGQSLIVDRPFRQPHHTASVAALVGGGRIPKPGELSLAHHGVLFLDEFPEFNRDHIEALRQPLENGIVTVSRVAGAVDYPAAALLVAAMNPYPCGWFGDVARPCHCATGVIARYVRRISGPILDRFDLFVHVPRVSTSDFEAPAAGYDPRSAIQNARARQTRRTGDPRLANSRLRGADLESIARISDDGRQLLHQALDRMHISMRGYHRLIRVARTIADLADQDEIPTAAVAEALQFRPPPSLVDSPGR